MHKFICECSRGKKPAKNAYCHVKNRSKRNAGTAKAIKQNASNKSKQGAVNCSQIERNTANEDQHKIRNRSK